MAHAQAPPFLRRGHPDITLLSAALRCTDDPPRPLPHLQTAREGLGPFRQQAIRHLHDRCLIEQRDNQTATNRVGPTEPLNEAN